MMDDYISLSALNDFIFCPYSIYLHNVYMESDKDIFQAVPQTTGKIAHRTIDLQTAKGGKFDLAGISVQSEELKIRGKIDLYRFNKKLLVERKYQLKQIFRGQLYQLWGEYFCMVEMGYEVMHIAFYEISTNKMYMQNLPSERDKAELIRFIDSFRTYDLSYPIKINRNKCMHCIYCNLCDKTDVINVYT